MSYLCYIDETGDEAIDRPRASRWFIIGALMLPDNEENDARKTLSTIKERFNKPDLKPLHWKTLRHEQKLYICSKYKDKNWSFTCVLTDKHNDATLESNKLKEKGCLYNYQTKLLLERVSWFARDNGNKKAVITFEHRRGINYHDMKCYLKNLKSEQTSIAWNNIDIEEMKVVKKEQEALLQACDNMCGAIKDGLECNAYGDIEPRCALRINELLYRYNGKVYSYGLKVAHCEDEDDYRQIEKEYNWLLEISDFKNELTF